MVEIYIEFYNDIPGAVNVRIWRTRVSRVAKSFCGEVVWSLGKRVSEYNNFFSYWDPGEFPICTRDPRGYERVKDIVNCDVGFGNGVVVDISHDDMDIPFDK